MLGVNGKLLYYKPILHNLSQRFRRFSVYTAEFGGNSAQEPIDIRAVGSFRRLYDDDRITDKQSGKTLSGISVASPAIFFRLLRDKPDLLIVSEFSLFVAWACLSTVFRRRVRILWLVESRPRLGPNRVLRLLRTWFRRKLVHFGDTFLTNNTAGRDYLVSDLRVPPSRVVVRPYLVSAMSGMSGNRRQSGPPVRFLYVGDLVARKGLFCLIDALVLVNDRLRPDFRLRIVGDGPSRAALERQVASAGLHGNVEFAGRVSYDDIESAYAGADVFVFPTLGDYRSLAVFEALTAGLAIIDSVHNGGHVETVAESENGYVVDPENADSLCTVIEKFIREPESIGRMQEKSASMARRYTLDSAVDALAAAAADALRPTKREQNPELQN